MLSSAAPPLTLRFDGPAPGGENMRRDLELLGTCMAGDNPGAIRVYWFAPACLSLGRLQPDTEVDREACARDGVDVVRRPSGGRAVLHDQEVTYAVVCGVSDPHLGGDVLTACGRIHHAVAAGLLLLGVRTTPRPAPADVRADAHSAAGLADCFARPAAHELLDVHGCKLVGSAQSRRAGALLQHGSVLLEPPHASRYVGGAVPAALTRGIRGLLGRPVSREELASALLAGFRATLGDRVLDTTL